MAARDVQRQRQAPFRQQRRRSGQGLADQAERQCGPHGRLGAAAREQQCGAERRRPKPPHGCVNWRQPPPDASRMAR